MGILGIEMNQGLYLNGSTGKKHLASSQLVTIFYVKLQVQKIIHSNWKLHLKLLKILKDQH